MSVTRYVEMHGVTAQLASATRRAGAGAPARKRPTPVPPARSAGTATGAPRQKVVGQHDVAPRGRRAALFISAAALLVAMSGGYTASAQAAPGGGPQRPPGMSMPARSPNATLKSPEVSADGRITFRYYAPKATAVTVVGENFPVKQGPLVMQKDDKGVWSVTTAPVSSGAYRYTFNVDGATVVDDRNPATLATPTGVESVVEISVTPDDIQADRPGIPHGVIETVYYDSPVAGHQRRMHMYLPPNYHVGKDFPVLYLIHGGGNGDDAWPTVGRVGFILDNLIAEGKAKPMVVVMPNGGVNGGQPMVWEAAKDPFTADLMTVIIPYVQAHYKVSSAPSMRALAGLSMGGIQALNIGLTHTADFAYVGIFSSGWFPKDRAAFQAKYGPTLRQQTAKLKLLWLGYGSADIARQNSEALLKMLTADGVKYSSEMTPGEHAWYNWRLYLSQFAPRLFR